MFAKLLKERRRELQLAVIVFTCVFGLMVMTIDTHRECVARNTSRPDAPIYPNSTITAFNDYSAENERRGRYYSLLETEDSVEDVIEFYSSVSTCLETHSSCAGEAEPFGCYYVAFLDDQGATRFRLEVYWDKCYRSSGWEYDANSGRCDH